MILEPVSCLILHCARCNKAHADDDDGQGTIHWESAEKIGEAFAERDDEEGVLGWFRLGDRFLCDNCTEWDEVAGEWREKEPLRPVDEAYVVREQLGYTQPGAIPQVRITKYLVSCLPQEHPDAPLFTLAVEWLIGNRWTVTNQGGHLDAAGVKSFGFEWSGGVHEPATDEERDSYNREYDAWQDAHRFDMDTALNLAHELAPKMAYRQYRVADALAAHQGDAEAGHGGSGGGCLRGCVPRGRRQPRLDGGDR